MKIQDITFFTVLGLLVILKKPQWFVYAGLFSLLAAVPLFAGWIFFSAQRLTWYAAAFFGIYIIWSLRFKLEATS